MTRQRGEIPDLGKERFEAENNFEKGREHNKSAGKDAGETICFRNVGPATLVRRGWVIHRLRRFRARGFAVKKASLGLGSRRKAKVGLRKGKEEEKRNPAMSKKKLPNTSS